MEKIFESKDIDKDKIDISELTTAEFHDLNKPIIISEKIKSLIDSDLGLLIFNNESKVIRIVKVNSKKLFKIIISLQNPIPFVKKIIDFYKNNNIDIVFTTGICFRGENMEDCMYESYINLENADLELTQSKMTEELEKIEGVEKSFVNPIQMDENQQVK